MAPERWNSLRVALLVVPLGVLTALAAPVAAQEAAPTSAGAQAEQAPSAEVAGTPQGSYVWGEQENNDAPVEQGFMPGRIFASLGVGGTLRFIEHLDLGHEGFLLPVYLDASAAYVLEGGSQLTEDMALRHGIGLGISTNLTQDGVGTVGVYPLEQWVLTPQYHAFLPMLDDWLILQGTVGLPIVLSSNPPDGVDFSMGVELAAGAIFKFLAGLGAYVQLDFNFFMGQAFTTHPMLSLELGMVVDYELLP